MASKGGSEKGYYDKLRAQGRNTVTPAKFARNNLSMGGVNKDLGGGWAGKGKTSMGRGLATKTK